MILFHTVRDDHKSISMPPVLSELDDLNDESSKFTPTFTRGNKFFGIPLTDSANNSPRWTYRISRKSPLEKTEFASESNEVTQSDFDDAVLSNLNRQVRLDRKSLMALYMELDEERSASAVAANNAMAMITRLQAEKAAVQMEALQYQRMMEEQAEYDEEALQASTEEVQALQAELEVYKKQYGCLAEGVISSLRNSSSFRFNEGHDNQVASSQTENGGIRHSESVKAFKAERAHLLGRIKKVESRNPFEESGVYSSLLSSSDSVNNLDNEKGNIAGMPS